MLKLGIFEKKFGFIIMRLLLHFAVIHRIYQGVVQSFQIHGELFNLQAFLDVKTD